MKIVLFLPLPHTHTHPFLDFHAFILNMKFLNSIFIAVLVTVNMMASDCT